MLSQHMCHPTACVHMHCYVCMYVCMCIAFLCMSVYVCVQQGRLHRGLPPVLKKQEKKEKNQNKSSSVMPTAGDSVQGNRQNENEKKMIFFSGIPDGDFRAARPRNSSTQIIECHAHCWDSVHGEDKVAPVPYMGTYVHVYVISHMYMYMYICVCVCVCVVHMSMYMLYLIYMYICIYIYI